MNSAAETTAPLTPPPALATPKRPAAARRTRASLGAARPAVFALLALGAIAWSVRAGLHAYRYEETEDAYVVGHLHQVSAQTDGQVVEVLVQDNRPVQAGEVLLRLDPLVSQIAVQKAEAGVAQAQAQASQVAAAARQADAQLTEARAHVAQADAQLAQADAQLGLAKLTLARNEQLFAQGGAVTAADVDNARSAFQAAQAASAAAQANGGAARASVGSAEAAQTLARAQADAARAALAAAEAARHDAQRLLAYATIVAPAAGRVGNKHVEVGDRVLAGQALLALAEPETWIVANFKETQLARMHVGQAVDLTIDAVPDAPLHGTIDSVSPASGAQFALLPPDNSTGNFNKVVQRLPVKIVLDPASLKQIGDRLRYGLSAVVSVRTR